jgi:hypothetical protein
MFTVIAMLSFCAVPAMAFLDDNSGQTNANADANADSKIVQIDNTVNEAMERGFANPGHVNYGPVINYYGKPLPTSQFRPVESLLMYATLFSENALKAILKKGNNILHELEVVNGPTQVVRAKYAEGKSRWIRIIATSKKQEDHKLIGFATSEAENRKTSMIEVVAQAALDALEEGADVLQIVAQGASRDTMANGWGIGFSSTQAVMGDGATGSGGSNTSVFGLGYSSTQAMMRDKPWIQANALKAPKHVEGPYVK